MAQQENMSLPDFQKKFGTDEACREHLFKIRWPEGPVCPKCGKKEFYTIRKRNIYECKGCGQQVSLTAGTIMHGSHTPLHKWFLAAYLTGHDKRGVSALRLKSELGVAYQTAWTMLHKVRKAMKRRDGEYKLGGIVEIDETYIGGSHEGGKRGRGTDKTPVEVAVSLDKEGKPLFVKAEAMKDVTAKSLYGFAGRNIETGAAVKTDEYGANKKAFADSEYSHECEKFDIKGNPGHLKWLHRIAGNMKAFMLGTYHGLALKHFQAYLDEFCFRLNRRRWPGQILNRVLNACMLASPVTYRDIVQPVLSG